MTPEQTVDFIEILNHHEVLSFSGKDPIVLDLGSGAEVKIWDDGTQDWFLNGKLHRTDGPAVIWTDGAQEWFLNGKLHRTDGPAVIWFDGARFWYLNGQEITQKEHTQRTGR